MQLVCRDFDLDVTCHLTNVYTKPQKKKKLNYDCWLSLKKKVLTARK